MGSEQEVIRRVQSGLPARATGLLRAGVAWVVVVVFCAGCGGPPPVELPAPESGEFLTLEEQQALSGAQLAEYCKMLDDELVRLKRDIALAQAMTDSLEQVLDEVNAEHARVNQDARVLETELRRKQAIRKGVTKYRSREGDTLMGLSSLFYGNAAEWRKIYDANREKIENPGDTLKTGTQLIIPR